MQKDISYPRFPDSAFMRRFPEFSAEDLLLLARKGQLSLVTPQELQEQLVKRLDAPQTSINTLTSVVSFLHSHESSLVSSLPEIIKKFLSSPSLEYTERELLSLMKCLRKYNTSDLYKSILAETIPPLIFSRMQKIQFGKLQNFSDHFNMLFNNIFCCLLYTSDAADDTPCVDLGGRRSIKKKN
eukprot:TRINITY_DN7207_c0_g1_i5.p1 TRINITY_DN7207_c0_g1~~TRINITY_DN7207_c0_g1_i5.p1  ORF type:complete len:184 (-),score=29.56 TRINITY_DN7207_c0_g1_i5:65-616(-)